jgi:hypothetical protein
MVMSVVDSTFFTLNEVASTIWRAADGTTPLDEIVARAAQQAGARLAEGVTARSEGLVWPLSMLVILFCSVLFSGHVASVMPHPSIRCE